MPSSKGEYAMKAENIWLQGKGFIFEREELCFGCQFTMLIEAPENAKIKINANFEEEIRKLLPTEPTYDILRKGEIRTYELDL